MSEPKDLVLIDKIQLKTRKPRNIFQLSNSLLLIYGFKDSNLKNVIELWDPNERKVTHKITLKKEKNSEIYILDVIETISKEICVLYHLIDNKNVTYIKIIDFSLTSSQIYKIEKKLYSIRQFQDGNFFLSGQNWYKYDSNLAKILIETEPVFGYMEEFIQIIDNKIYGVVENYDGGLGIVNDKFEKIDFIESCTAVCATKNDIVYIVNSLSDDEDYALKMEFKYIYSDKTSSINIEDEEDMTFNIKELRDNRFICKRLPGFYITNKDKTNFEYIIREQKNNFFNFIGETKNGEIIVATEYDFYIYSLPSDSIYSVSSNLNFRFL